MKAILLGTRNSIHVDRDTNYTVGRYTSKQGQTIGDGESLIAITGKQANILCRFAEPPTDAQAREIIASLVKEINSFAFGPENGIPPIINIPDFMQGIEGIPALYVEPEQPSEESAKSQMHTPSVAGSGKTFLFDRVKVSPETAERIIEGLLSLQPNKDLTQQNMDKYLESLKAGDALHAPSFNSTIHPTSLHRQGWKWISPESEKSRIWKKGETRITYHAGESFGDDGHVSSIIVFGTEYMLHPVITKFSVLEEKIAELEKLQGGPRQAKETEQPAKVNVNGVSSNGTPINAESLIADGWMQRRNTNVWVKDGAVLNFEYEGTPQGMEVLGIGKGKQVPEPKTIEDIHALLESLGASKNEARSASSSNDPTRPEIILRENGWEWDIPNQQYNKDGVDGWILIDPNGACLYDKGIRPFWPLIWDRIKPFQQWLSEDVEGSQPAQHPDPKKVLKANGWVPTGAITWRSKFHPTLEVRTSGRGDWSVYRHADPKGGTNEWNPKQFPNFEDWLVQACDKWEWSPITHPQRYHTILEAHGWYVAIQDGTKATEYGLNGCIEARIFLKKGHYYCRINGQREDFLPGEMSFSKWVKEQTERCKAQATITAHDTAVNDKVNIDQDIKITRKIKAKIKEREAVLEWATSLLECDFQHGSKSSRKINKRIENIRSYLADLRFELEQRSNA